MVLSEEKPRILEASCCRVLVMKGAGGSSLREERLIALKTAWADSILPMISTALASSGISSFLPSHFSRLALKGGSPSRQKLASSFQNSRGTKARISASRSQIRRNATDCTRPALRSLAITLQSRGETV